MSHQKIKQENKGKEWHLEILLTECCPEAWDPGNLLMRNKIITKEQITTTTSASCKAVPYDILYDSLASQLRRQANFGLAKPKNSICLS